MIMKKITSIIIAVIILVLSFSVCASAAKGYVFDYTGTMTEQQKTSIESTCKDIYNKYRLDVIFVIANGTGGKSLERFTTDLYDDYCDGDDGVVFVFNTAPVDDYEDNWIMLGFGQGKNLAGNKNTRSDLIDQMRYYLKSGRYYEASTFFTAKCLSFAEGGMNGDPVSAGEVIKYIIIAFMIGLIISGVIMSGMKKKLNTAVKQRAASQYVKKDTAKINVSRDLFLYSTTSRIRKESNSSGGGHSYSGTSSGGHSYSGGGGRI